MPTDAFELPMSAANDEGAAAFDKLVSAYLGFRRDTGDCLKAALAADPNLVLAHVLKGYFYLLFCDPQMDGRVVKTLEAAEAAAGKANERERRHINALHAWSAQDLVGAITAWEGILLRWPRDVVALRLAHFTHFYLGDARQLRDSVARVLPLWNEGDFGHSYVLGMWAFGLEECGDYARAEEAGRRAVQLNPANIWAVHAVAHVMEMQGRFTEGIEWLTETEPDWALCNNFVYHVWWHRALFHLELGEHSVVLDQYDNCFRADDESEDYLDMSNAIAMLWRLDDAGVDVGNRWHELANKSEKRIDDHVLTFIDAHLVMALAADLRQPAIDKLLATMVVASEADTSQACVYREVGIPLCQAVVAYRAGDFESAVDWLWPIRYQIVRIGGSHAQRDVFQQTLINAALKAGRGALARGLLAERVAIRPNSPRSWTLYARCLDQIGDTSAAADARSHAAALGSS